MSTNPEATSKQLIEQQKIKAAIIQSMDTEAIKILIDDMLVREKTLVEDLIKAQNETVMFSIQGEIKGIREFIKSYFGHMSVDISDKKRHLY
jgi:hypothetical protein